MKKKLNEFPQTFEVYYFSMTFPVLENEFLKITWLLQVFLKCTLQSLNRSALFIVCFECQQIGFRRCKTVVPILSSIPHKVLCCSNAQKLPAKLRSGIKSLSLYIDCALAYPRQPSSKTVKVTRSSREHLGEEHTSFFLAGIKIGLRVRKYLTWEQKILTMFAQLYLTWPEYG